MCRHLAYLGPRVSVNDPVLRGPHSLYRQAWAPREMRGGGEVNVDGFGVAWWRPDGNVSVHRNNVPIWTDPVVNDVLAEVNSTAVLAAIRSATVGMALDRSLCAPFTNGKWAFSHNGSMVLWRELLTEWVAGTGLGLELAGQSDSAAIWLLIRDALKSLAPGEAVRSVTTRLLDLAPEARLNFLLSDGETIWATTVYHALYVLDAGDHVVVSSEPYDDDERWQPIADHQLVTARLGDIRITDLMKGSHADADR